METTSIRTAIIHWYQCYRAWIIWLVAAAFCFYQFLLQSSTSVMVQKLQRDFAISAEGVGFLSACFFYTYIILQIPSGLLTDRIGARKILLVGLISCIIFSIIFGMSQSAEMAGFARFGMGLASAPAVASIMWLAGNWFPPEKFALVAGLTEALGMLGGALGEAALAQSVDVIGWRSTMYLCAAVGCVIAIFTWFIVFDRPSHSKNGANAKSLSIKQQLMQVVTLPQAWIAGIFSGLIFAVLSAFAGLWCVTYVQVRYGVSLEKAAIASAMTFIGTVLGTPFLGWVSERLKSRKKAMAIGSIGALISMCIILYVPIDLYGMFIVLFILGFCCGSYVICFAVVGDLTPQSVRGTAMGFTNLLCIMIGSPILQPFIGYLLERNWDGSISQQQHFYSIHDYTLALSTLPICIGIAILLLILLKENHR